MTVGLLSIVSPSAPTSLLKFNFVTNFYNTSWNSAPPAYVTALANSAALLSAAFPNANCTLNISVEYGTFQGSAIAGNQSVGGDAYGSANASYTLIRNALAAIPSPSASLSALLANTPAGTTLNGQTTFYVPSPCLKAISLYSGAGMTGGPTGPTDARLDGLIGVGVSWGTGELIGMLLHELTHAMGREAGAAPFSFSRFFSAGNRDFSSNLNTTYFSLDGGTTPLANYDTTQDAGDFANGGVQDGNTGAGWTSFASDPFDTQQSSNSIQSLTTVGTKLLNVMGFQ